MIDDATLDSWTRQAYQAYGQVTGHKNYQGNPMPAFDDLGETIQAAWRAAVLAVRNLTAGLPPVPPTAEPVFDGSLTAPEHRAVQLSGQLASALSALTGYGVTRLDDLRELLGHVHAIQHAVMAQAAARAYPNHYRLLGAGPVTPGAVGPS